MYQANILGRNKLGAKIRERFSCENNRSNFVLERNNKATSGGYFSHGITCGRLTSPPAKLNPKCIGKYLRDIYRKTEFYFRENNSYYLERSLEINKKRRNSIRKHIGKYFSSFFPSIRAHRINSSSTSLVDVISDIGIDFESHQQVDGEI